MTVISRTIGPFSNTGGDLSRANREGTEDTTRQLYCNHVKFWSDAYEFSMRNIYVLVISAAPSRYIEMQDDHNQAVLVSRGRITDAPVTKCRNVSPG